MDRDLPGVPQEKLTLLTESSAGIRVTVHVQPKAARSELAGRHGDALKIRLAAPPVAGAANEELIRFLAALLGTSRSSIEIRSGHTARRKVVEVQGVTLAAVRAALRL